MRKKKLNRIFLGDCNNTIIETKLSTEEFMEKYRRDRYIPFRSPFHFDYPTTIIQA